MLVIVAILLIFGFVVHQKWRNAAAKKEEILRLGAVASEEEAEISNLQTFEEYNSSSLLQPQLENQNYCAVCYCPTTTRCSQCKAVRYCSGKCQIIHWRQGHKDDCRSAFALPARKESEGVLESAAGNPIEMHLNSEHKICSGPTQEIDDCGSSSTSLPCFSSSTERSETSFDSSISEFFEPRTPIRPDVDVDSHMSRTTSDSDDAEVPSPSPSNSTVYYANNALGAGKIKKTQPLITDEDFHSISFKYKRTGNGAAMLEDFFLGKTELRSSESSSSLRTSSSSEDRKYQAESSNSKIMRYMSIRGSGHNQIPKAQVRSSQGSKSLSSSSEEYWKYEVQLCNGKEARSMSFRNSGNYQKMSTKTESPHPLPSKVKGPLMLSQPTSKGLKTLVRKFVQNFKAPKQSKFYAVDRGRASGGNYNLKVIFPPKLFMQLYSCDNVDLRPFGLLNCGNSCYVNAVLQCLTFTRPITSFLLQGLHSKTCHKKDWCFICEFEHVIQKGQKMNSPLSPVGILSQIQRIGRYLSHGREEDAHEFLRHVIDTMQSICLEEAGVSGALAEDSTLVGLTFGGRLQSKIKCLKCLGRYEQCDRMMDLTVEIDGDIDTLEEALAKFTTSETLGGDDKYKCSRCKSYERATKKLSVLEAPNILTIVLKRFQPSNLGKLNKPLHFADVLNLAPYMSGTSDEYPIYHLYAVTVHLDGMNTAYNGHYISYVKDFRGDWFRIDDSRVIPVDLESVLSAKAYILFYARHTPRGPSLVRNSNLLSDGKSKRDMEVFSMSNSAKNSKTNASSSDKIGDSTMLHQWSNEHLHDMSSKGFAGNHIVNLEEQRFHSKRTNPIFDSSSDCSSIFSSSDAGSYNTDSTKDSDLSGYIFGPSWDHP